MMMRVIRPSAPLYDKPGHDNGRETDLLFGESVTILKNNGPKNNDGWAEVILATDGYQGWVEATALGTLPEPDHRVCVPRALMTKTADIKSPAGGWLPMAGLVTARPVADGVMAVHGSGETSGGMIGHVPARHLMPLGATVADWVASAEAMIGTPYRWGGRDGIGIDCSALVQLSLAMAGIAARRNSGDQEATLGRDIDRQDGLRRGDLVFWKGHVGIMTDAETLLHANMYHGMTASEPLDDAITRLAGLGLPVTRFARL